MNRIYETVTECRICKSKNFEIVLDLGNQPPANSLYEKDSEMPPEVPLRLMFCNDCKTVQLGESVEPNYLFSRYVWVTGTSESTKSYSKIFAQKAFSRLSTVIPSVLEIASNDGTFLKPFIEAGCDVLGVDPAVNIAKMASNNGVPTIDKFFSEAVAEEIKQTSGLRDLVFARNVLPHVKEIHSVVSGLKTLLSEDGIGIIEFHDAGLIMKELHYDSIYHEHLFFFSLETMSSLLSKYNLNIFDVSTSSISGGSWVVYFSKKRKDKTTALLTAIENEKKKGINTIAEWKSFALRAIEHSENLKKILNDSKERVVAYGASARSSTLLNFCNIDKNDIKFILDKNPMKNGLITPGTEIPIVAFDDFVNEVDKYNTILLLAWNFKEEVIQDLRSSGFTGKFIIPLPYKPEMI
ncbi:MAG: hypothetical protein CBC25_04410 [Pelagibacteraceae bacterium TMED65]|nr:MAG: hypothetical protein CBC25_04410 [Pelagibacteraceae bacterium TMED65]|tara:strand:+ start:2087 stop:3313 length:1227 start_codon:yes stop_codon:yes gene_type:complete